MVQSLLPFYLRVLEGDARAQQTALHQLLQWVEQPTVTQTSAPSHVSAPPLVVCKDGSSWCLSAIIATCLTFLNCGRCISNSKSCAERVKLVAPKTCTNTVSNSQVREVPVKEQRSRILVTDHNGHAKTPRILATNRNGHAKMPSLLSQLL